MGNKRMIELEVLVEILDTYENAVLALSKYEHIKDSLIIDEYFYDPLRKNLKPDSFGKTFECLRIRQCQKENKLTYKQDVYKKGVWQYSNENELTIKDANSLKQIFHHLGLKELLTIRNNRKYYRYDNYEIVLEEVNELGVFLEVEYKGVLSEANIQETRNGIKQFIGNLDLCTSPELNAGKPELFIKKHNIMI